MEQYFASNVAIISNTPPLPFEVIDTVAELKQNAFTQYILRKLGSPVIHIEVSEDQITDCIDETLLKFYEQHYDGVDIGYVILDLTDGVTTYTLDDEVQAVTEVLSKGVYFLEDEPLLMNKPFVLGNAPLIGGPNLIDVEIFRQSIKMIENAFNQDVVYDFNSTSKLLTLHIDPAQHGFDKVALKVYQSHATDLFENIWVKRYAVALTRIQWGSNLSKYSGATLPGGVQFNGEDIKRDGKEDKEALELELEERYSEPPDPMVG